IGHRTLSARISSDGVLGKWEYQTPVPEDYDVLDSITVSDRQIYILTHYDTIVHASIGEDGTLSAWAPAYPFRYMVQEAGLIAMGGKVYLTGGRKPNSPGQFVYPYVYYAETSDLVSLPDYQVSIN